MAGREAGSPRQVEPGQVLFREAQLAREILNDTHRARSLDLPMIAAAA